VLLAALLLTAIVSSAEPIAQIKPTNYVNDFAHVLSAETAAQLNSTAQQIDQKANAQIALVTINSLDGNDIESYAVELFKQWGIGRKGTDRGVLILYVIRDRRARIEVGYGLEPILPDGKVGGFQREAIPQMRAGDYNGALSLVFGRVAQTIAADAGVQLTGPQPRAPAAYRQPQQGFSLTGFLAVIAIFLIILMTPARGILFYILWALLSGGGGRGGGSSWGGGGFGGGGGGGGGGFGGFGGGSSGGGGASSSW
jgi:uncharacterized protein